MAVKLANSGLGGSLPEGSTSGSSSLLLSPVFLAGFIASCAPNVKNEDPSSRATAYIYVEFIVRLFKLYIFQTHYYMKHMTHDVYEYQHFHRYLKIEAHNYLMPHGEMP